MTTKDVPKRQEILEQSAMFSIKSVKKNFTALNLTMPFFRNVQAKSPTMGPSMNLGNQFGDNINASLKVKTIGEIVKSSSFKLIDQFYNVTSDSPRMPLVCWAATE